MPGDLIGSARQLSAILQRHFVAIGNPPTGSQWIIPVYKRKSPFHGIDLLESARNFFAKKGKLGEVTAECQTPFAFEDRDKAIRDDFNANNRFGALLSNNSWLIEQAKKHIPPISEAAVAIKDVSDELANSQFGEYRFTHIFSWLLDSVPLFSLQSSNEFWNTTSGFIEYGCGLTLFPVGQQNIDSFDASILELDQVVTPAAQNEPSSAEAARIESQLKPQVQLDSDEQDIVNLLREAGHRMTTAQILAAFSGKGIIKAESTIKGKLATLVRFGILTNMSDCEPRGYGLPEW